MNKLFSWLESVIPHAFFLNEAKKAALSWILEHIPGLSVKLAAKIQEWTGKEVNSKDVEEFLSDAFDLIEVTVLADGTPAPAGSKGVAEPASETPANA
jgi:hypothetical protein